MHVRVELSEHCAVSHLTDLGDDRCAQSLEPVDPCDAGGRGARPCGSHEHDRLAVGPGQDADLHGQLIGHRRVQHVIPAQDLFGLMPREPDEAGDDGVKCVQAHPHTGHHTEVSAAAAQRPEQIGLVSLVDDRCRSVVEHDLERNDVIECQSRDAVERSVPAGQRQTDDSDAAVGSGRRHQAEWLGRRRRHRLRSIRPRRTRSAM